MMESVGMMTFPTEWKNNQNVPNHQPDIVIWEIHSCAKITIGIKTYPSRNGELIIQDPTWKSLWWEPENGWMTIPRLNIELGMQSMVWLDAWTPPYFDHGTLIGCQLGKSTRSQARATDLWTFGDRFWIPTLKHFSIYPRWFCLDVSWKPKHRDS